MARTVNIHDAKTHLSRLLEDVVAGQEIILARNGKPLARLVPFREDTDREMGFVAYHVPESFFEPLPEEELAAWQDASSTC